MGTLAIQSEIGVWVQVQGDISPLENFEIVYAKSYNLLHFWSENCSQCRPLRVLKHFTTDTPFSCVPAAFQQRERRFASR